MRSYLPPHIASLRGRFGVLTAVLAVAVTCGVACGGQVDGAPEGASAGQCISTRQRFATELVAEVLQPKCAGCHTPGATPISGQSKFLLERESYPTALETNFERLRSYAQLEGQGAPKLLLNARGEDSHPGGTILDVQSVEYKHLAGFVAELRSGQEQHCDGEDELGVALLSFRQRYRKAAILLAARVPSEQELLVVNSEATLASAIRKLTEEEPFYEFLRETWNDELLTQRHVDAAAFQAYGHAPDLYDTTDPGYSGEKRQWASLAATEEPLRLIESIVRRNRPFSEVVSGTEIVANPWSARAYGLSHPQAATPEAYGAWQAFEVAPSQKRGTAASPAPSVVVPVAGVLTTPSFLSRWETTPTNKGRKRASVVMRSFLATDIFKFAQRTVDATILSAGQSATKVSPECNVCHTTLDPIAGGFRGFNPNQLTYFSPDDKWYEDLFAPGFEGVAMPAASSTKAAAWLGGQVAADPRFAIAVTRVMARGMMGDVLLSVPKDAQSADYKDQLRAYDAQSRWLSKTARAFAAAKYDLRALVSSIATSVYFAGSSSQEGSEALHAGLGDGRLLTANQLARKLLATTGLYFFEGSGTEQYNAYTMERGYVRSNTDVRANHLLGDPTWNALLGGIDSQDLLKRADALNPTMRGAQEYIAALQACRVSSFEFSKPASKRRLFAHVEQDTTPFARRTAPTQSSTPIAENEARIRQNLVALYWRLLGEEWDPASEEISRTYAFFADVWTELEQADLAKIEGNSGKLFASARCNAEVDFDGALAPGAGGKLEYPKLAPRGSGAVYAFGEVLREDPNYTIRAWQAVLTYLLSDFRFGHD